MKQLQEDNHFSLFQWGNFVNIFFFFLEDPSLLLWEVI